MHLGLLGFVFLYWCPSIQGAPAAHPKSPGDDPALSQATPRARDSLPASPPF